MKHHSGQAAVTTPIWHSPNHPRWRRQYGAGSNAGPIFVWASHERQAQLRTRLSICGKKARYPSEAEALAIARNADIPLRTYRCDRCRQFHLTSRTKGKRVPRPVG